MPTVVFIEHSGDRFEVDAPIGKSLMQVALDNGVPGILGDCGGSCSCATCHGYVDERWAAELPEKSETEVFMLEGVPDLRPNSRLCCQIRMKPQLEGIVVHLPQEQV
ncbi:MAG TPA: 2Fe-2S iron-sulfur cluster-binding protein [Ramlibacter sp.]|uniref:2Fe-2S iron-sulfur cluster-binding protein n=1 Tax=Ramlibacter sp. TaxID=1917967 RepID=UPI002D0645D6|nr:2Fe-2S iron-sulfur cluster-binding protein [Ramlibacter sp.]HVZ44194.1 2Fe-2S iron-sulfur cluster-binding protein [Ramlibacter sp.]